MKILDDWKVYGGVSDLKQQAEAIPVSQVIINSNYSDDHDDYDIALMKLSRPLTLSGEASQLVLLWGWCSGGWRDSGNGQGQEAALSPHEKPFPGLLPAGASTLLCPFYFPMVGNHPILPWQVLALTLRWAGGPAETLRGWAQIGVLPAHHAPPWPQGW